MLTCVLTTRPVREIKKVRSVRECGILLAQLADAGQLPALSDGWKARALSTAHLQRLHHVVCELAAALELTPPPAPLPKAGAGGETSESDDEPLTRPPGPALRKRPNGFTVPAPVTKRKTSHKTTRVPPAAPVAATAAPVAATAAPAAAAASKPPPVLRLRQTRGPPLSVPACTLPSEGGSLHIGRLQCRLELASGPQPLRFLPGSNGLLRYGAGQALRIGRGPCTPNPEGNNVQLEGSSKVSRLHAQIAWDGARSAFCVTDLSSVGTILDGRKLAPREPTPLSSDSTLAFYGNPSWSPGRKIEGDPPPDVFALRVRSLADGPSRWELPSPCVSRSHCTLNYDARAGCCTVTDSNSHFGTAVDGTRVAAGQPATLRAGQELELCCEADGGRALAFVLEQASSE